jgi:multidrug efflux pump subunit AcrA (membrane-fusion protein)
LEETDYKLALAREKSNLVTTQYAVKLELGRQEVAQREWDLLGARPSSVEIDSDLALRKPHMAKVEADQMAAEADMEKAALDLARTQIRAPFNAIVKSKAVEVGSQVSAQEPLAELIGTDLYQVRASLPVDRLGWIRIPDWTDDTGSTAKIYYTGGHTIDGKVTRLMGSLAEEGLMAHILIDIQRPLDSPKTDPNAPPLLIGESVRIEIEGRVLENVYTIPRTALRDGSTVWVATPDMTLAIREVVPVWRDEKTVVIQDNLKPSDHLIVSDLSAPVQGMAIRIATERLSDDRLPAPAAAGADRKAHNG